MSAAPAQTLDDAQKVLDVQPLRFGEGAGSPASNPDFYVGIPQRKGLHQDPRRVNLQRLRLHVLDAQSDTKLFLSGHVGAGKSTELNRLLTDEEVQAKFFPILLRFEEQEVSTLDAPQVLFAMAAEICKEGTKQGLLSQEGTWTGALRALDDAIYGDTGITTKEGSLALEFNLVFVKLRQELKLSENRRKKFRDLGETLQSILKDLLTGLVKDVESHLKNRRLLLFIDDLDKVRRADQQEELFSRNLSLLFVPKFPVLYTLPSGIGVGETFADVRRRATHLYPRRVLEKDDLEPRTFDPEKAFKPQSETFFREALHARVAPALFEDGVARLAVIYSGGVLRDFFRLLGEAVTLARIDGLDAVTLSLMNDVVASERLRESQGLLASDWQTLSDVHETHQLFKPEDRRLLDMGRVMECYNDTQFYEVNPLLWKPLQQKATKGARTNANAPAQPARK